MTDLRVLAVSPGNMGISHARARRSIAGFKIAGLCSPVTPNNVGTVEEIFGSPRILLAADVGIRTGQVVML